MKSLNLAARRGALVTVAAASALALASCSAGQVTQTSSQVAAVDGNQAAQAGDSPELVFATPAQPAAGAPLAAIERQQAEMEDVLATPDPAGEFYGTYHPRNPKPGEPMTAN